MIKKHQDVITLEGGGEQVDLNDKRKSYILLYSLDRKLSILPCELGQPFYGVDLLSKLGGSPTGFVNVFYVGYTKCY